MGASLSNLGAMLIIQGRYEEAEPFVREGLEVRRKVLGNSHPDTAGSWYRLADLLYSKGDYKGAESACREALEIYKRTLPRPQDTINFSTPLNEFGMILNKMGRSREAETYAREALEIRTRLLTPGHRLIGSSKAALGESLRLQKRYAEAEPILVESYNILKTTSGDGDPRMKEVRQSLKMLYEAWHKPEKAASY